MKLFSEQLSTLRRKANLTNKQLAELAKVPASLVAGLQSGKRRVGEYQANKLGTALGLVDPQLQAFVYAAINNSARKVLKTSKDYPAELLNFLAELLRKAGVLAEYIVRVAIDADDIITLWLKDGTKATLSTQLIHA